MQLYPSDSGLGSPKHTWTKIISSTNNVEETGYPHVEACLALSVESFRLLNNPYRGRMGIVRPTGQVVAVEHTGKAEPMSSVPTQVSLTLVQILTSVKSNLQKHHLQMCGIFWHVPGTLSSLTHLLLAPSAWHPEDWWSLTLQEGWHLEVLWEGLLGEGIHEYISDEFSMGEERRRGREGRRVNPDTVPGACQSPPLWSLSPRLPLSVSVSLFFCLSLYLRSLSFLSLPPALYPCSLPCFSLSLDLPISSSLPFLLSL